MHSRNILVFLQTGVEPYNWVLSCFLYAAITAFVPPSLPAKRDPQIWCSTEPNTLGSHLTPLPPLTLPGPGFQKLAQI